MTEPLNLPDADARLLLDASLWMGVPENERTALQRAMSSRAAALANAQRGAPWVAAHEADLLMRRAFSELYARVAHEAGLPLGALTDAQAQNFLTRLLCSEGDASPLERGLATKTAISSVSAMRSAEAMQPNRFTTRIALMVLAGVRRSMRGVSGVLAFDDTLSMHRAVGLVFSTSDVVSNARRARLVVTVVQGASFETLWDNLRSYEIQINTV